MTTKNASKTMGGLGMTLITVLMLVVPLTGLAGLIQSF